MKGPIYFRLPDLMVIASEEPAHDIDEPSEFTAVITGVIMDSMDVTTCDNCQFPQDGSNTICANDACKQTLKESQRIRFWKMAPDMQNVKLDIKSLTSPDNV